MAPKKGKLDLAIVMGKPGGAPPAHDERMEGEEPEDSDGDEMAHEDAMSEMTDAMHAKDMSRAVEAFKVLYDLCKTEHESGSDEEEGEEY